MIPNHWYPIAYSIALRRQPLALRRGGLDLVLFRDERGQPMCLLDRCPHRGVPLRLGAVRSGRLVCGYHGFEFDGAGACVHMPCEGPGAHIPAGMSTPAFRVTERERILWLFWGAEELADEVPVPALESAAGFGGVSHDTSLEWPLHYANSLENNFDIHHFNWVHKSQAWAMRFADRVGEVEVLPRSDGLDLRAEVRAEAGEPGRAETFRVEFRAPSLQAIKLGEKNLVTVYDAPVDATTTYRMIRVYHRAIKIPGVRRVAVRMFSLLAARYAQLHEDLRFARWVAPPGQDRPVRADAGITAYRKYRREALRRVDVNPLPPHVRDAMNWDGVLDSRAPKPTK